MSTFHWEKVLKDLHFYPFAKFYFNFAELGEQHDKTIKVK